MPYMLAPALPPGAMTTFAGRLWGRLLGWRAPRDWERALHRHEAQPGIARRLLEQDRVPWTSARDESYDRAGWLFNHNLRRLLERPSDELLDAVERGRRAGAARLARDPKTGLTLAGILLYAGANPDIIEHNNRWDSPVHLAGMNGRVEEMELMLARGADFDKKNSLDETPLDCLLTRRAGGYPQHDGRDGWLWTAYTQMADKVQTVRGGWCGALTRDHAEVFIRERLPEAMRAGALGWLHARVPFTRPDLRRLLVEETRRPAMNAGVLAWLDSLGCGFSGETGNQLLFGFLGEGMDGYSSRADDSVARVRDLALRVGWLDGVDEAGNTLTHALLASRWFGRDPGTLAGMLGALTECGLPDQSQQCNHAGQTPEAFRDEVARTDGWTLADTEAARAGWQAWRAEQTLRASTPASSDGGTAARPRRRVRA